MDKHKGQQSMPKRAVSKQIECCIAREDWQGARLLIEIELKIQPEDHWLITRLGLTYYEERHHTRALELSERAMALAPGCPLVLWDYAGALAVLDRDSEAMAIYQRLIERGIEPLATGQCGEGRAWARGLYADCFYCMSQRHLALGEKTKAINALQHHLAQRGPGCHSIYPLADVRRELRNLLELEIGRKSGAEKQALSHGCDRWSTVGAEQGVGVVIPHWLLSPGGGLTPVRTGSRGPAKSYAVPSRNPADKSTFLILIP